MMLHLTFKNGTTIEWDHGQDGGGSTQYKDFLQAIPSNAKFKRCLEWCAGLSAISFSLLDAGVIEELVLIDKHEPSITQALLNAKNNGFSNVKGYVLDKISDIPNNEKFDLIVANPPHLNCEVNYQPAIDTSEMTIDDVLLHQRLLLDKDWNAHKEFFKNISNYLNNNAELYISENNTHPDLLQLIEQAGLKIVNIYKAPELSKSASNDQSVIMHIRYEEKIY